jgi:hypothetical protein
MELASRRKRIKRWIRGLLPERPIVVFQSFLALVSFVFYVFHAPMALTPNEGLSATPVPVNSIQFGEYDASGMQGYYEEVGAQAKDVDSWIALVSDNLGLQRAAWEADANFQIQSELDLVSESDVYNGIENYRDYLLKALDSQKEQAWELWEKAATTDIYLQLSNYVETYAIGIHRESENSNENNQTTVDSSLQNNRLTSRQIQEQFERSRSNWENSFSDSVEDGLKGYGSSLQTINDDYTRFQESLNEADANFQQNLQAIQEYKNNVINGIKDTVKGLRGFLNEGANQDLFYSAPNTLNSTGTALNDLLVKFETKLASIGTNDFSLVLTGLANDMSSYLLSQKNDAQTKADNYQSQIETRHLNNLNTKEHPTVNTYMDSNIGAFDTGDPVYRDGSLFSTVVGWNGSDNHDRYSAAGTGAIHDGYRQIKTWVDSGSTNTADLIAFIKSKYSFEDSRYTITIENANIFSQSGPNNFPKGGDWYGQVNTEQNYQRDKELFVRFTAMRNNTTRFVDMPQGEFGYKILYNVRDSVMATNTEVWQGFVNSLNSQFSIWSGNIAPAISNWEVQAANYKNFYDQWKGNADTLRANAKTEYDASVAKVEADRSKWILSMEEQKREADKEWESLAKQINATNGNLSRREMVALLSQAPSSEAKTLPSESISVADNFSSSLKELESTKFTFTTSDPAVQVTQASNVSKASGGVSEFIKFGAALDTLKSFVSDPFSSQASYSVFNPEIKAPELSVSGIDLDKAFTTSFNGVQNLAYVNGTVNLADKYQQEYYDSIVNQYKYEFNKEEMDKRKNTAFENYVREKYNMSATEIRQTLTPSPANLGTMPKNIKLNPELHSITAFEKFRTDYINKIADTDLLSDYEKGLYENGSCYKNVEYYCSGFMRVSKDLKSVRLENGQIVIEREISDGSVHRSTAPPDTMTKEGEVDYSLAGGYESGRKIDTIRVSLSKIGAVIKNPKELFTEWSNEDYNAIASNLRTATDELYKSGAKDSARIMGGIQDSYKRGTHYMNMATSQAKALAERDEFVKSVVQAYLTGGMAGIQSMIKDKIRDAFIDKVAEATGINPEVVRFAMGRFEQAKVAKKMDNQMGKLGAGVGVMASFAMGPIGPLMMAGPMGASLLGAGAGAKLGSKAFSSGAMRNSLNNPVVDATLTMASGLSGAMMGGPAGLVAGLAAKKKLMESNSIVRNNNEFNALKQQENALIQDAAGGAIANAIGRPDAAGNFSQILGGLKKRQVAKKNNTHLDKVVSNGVASGLNMANGMVKGIVKNAVVAFGGSGETFDQLTGNPFTPPATWTGVAKIDTSKAGLRDRIQEQAFAQLLEANGMDGDIARTVASTTNGKIKAKKAKKEERINAIESTVQTAISVAAAALTAGAATPLLTALNTTKTVAQAAVTATSIAAQAAIGSRKGGAQGAMAGALNGILQAAGSGMLSGAGRAMGMAETTITNIGNAEKVLRGINVSYDKENGWGVKANVSAAVQAIGVPKTTLNNVMERFTNVTIGQSQRGGASLNLGFNTGYGNVGLNYTGRDGRVDGSFDLIERDLGGVKLSSEINLGRDGLTVSGNMDMGNGYGLGVETGHGGVTGSLTILGSQQGSVDQTGAYTANQNFLGEINGQDVADLANTVRQREEAEAKERNPAKDGKDAKNAKDAKDSKDATSDDDGKKRPEEGPSGLVDLGIGALGALMTSVAAFVAGGSSSPARGQGSEGNTGNANGGNVARRREDEGDDSNEPPKKQPTKEELANFKDNIFWNTTRAATDAYLDKLDKQGVDTKEMRAHAEAQRNAGVRDLTAGEIKVKREKAAIAAFNRDGFFLDSNTGNFYVKQPDGGTKLFTKDEDGKEIIIVKDKDGKIKDRRESGVDVTDAIDLAKKPRQEAKIELVQATNAQKTNSTIPTEYKAKYSDDSEGGRLTRYSKAEGAEAKKAIDDKIRKEKGIEPNLNDARYWKAFIEEASKGKVKVFDKNNPMKIVNGEGKQLFFIKDGIEGFLPSKQKVDNEFSGQKDQKNKSKVETKIITTDFSDGDNIKLVNKLSNNQLEPFNYKGNDALVIFDKDGKLLVTLPILTKNPTTLNDPGDEYPWDNKLVKAPTPQGYDYKGFTILDVPANREINGNPDPNTQVIGNMDYVPTDEDKDKVVDIHGFLGTHGCKQISPLNQAGIKNPNSDEISIVYDAFKHKELPAFAKAREHKKNNPKAENWILGTIRTLNFPDKNSVKGKKK